MSYVIHITRDPCSEDRSNEITPEEWQRFAEPDPEFEMCDQAGGEKVYCWSAHPDRPVFYHYRSLGVGVSRRDESIFRKMFEVAHKMGAVLNGEQGEFYRLTPEGVEQYFENPADGSPAIVCHFRSH